MSGMGRRAIRLATIIAAGLAVSACMNGMSAKAPSSAPPSAPAERSAAPIKADNARFAFGSITGIPGRYFQSFSAALDHAAVAKKLTLARPGEQATYVIKGYVSAVSDPTETTLVYVFDVVDASGHRIHRISGKERGRQAGADPWSGITGETVAEAAKHAVDSLAEWVKTG
jgi:hypothetical protein